MKGGAGTGARHTPRPAVSRPLPPYARKPTTPTSTTAPTAPRSGSPPGSGVPGPAGTGSTAPAGSGGRRAIGQTVADEENPFDVDPNVMSKAVQVAKTRTAVKSFKVVCPMCETAGFIPPAAAGKDVRCGNPECIVPVFKAPFAPRKSSAETKTIDEGRGWTFWIVGTLALMAALGGAAWYFMSPPSTGGFKKMPPKPGQLEDDPVAEKPKEEVPVEETPVVEAPLTLEQVRKPTLDAMVRASQNPNGNRHKPYCRQATAETFAAVGDLAEARNQIERLRDVGRDLPYYQIMPLVTIAWQELKSGSIDDAKKTLDDAVKLTTESPGLPPYGSESLNIASSLAAALTAAGRSDEARKILRSRTETGTLANFVATWRAAFDSRSYDFETIAEQQALDSGAPPQWASVARSLTLRGYAGAALAWAEGSDSSEIRVDCTIAWAEALAGSAENASAESLAVIEPAAAKLSPAGKARLLARLAGLRSFDADKAQSEAWLAKARESLAAVPAPSAVTLPPLKDLYRFSLPDPSNLRLAALASAELARVETELGRNEQAWAAISKALTYLRGTAPAVPQIQARLDEIETRGVSAVRDDLKNALKLRNDDEAFQAMNQYRRNCEQILKDAQACFRLQTDILVAATEWGLAHEVWDEVRKRQIDKNRPERYFDTPLPAVIADDARRANDAQFVDQIVETVGNRNEGKPQEADLRIQLQQKTTELMKTGKPRNAAAEIQSFQSIDKTWRSEWTLRLLSSAVKAGKINDVFEFIAGLSDPLARELLLEAMGALSSRTGHGKEIQSRIESGALPSTEQVALCRGFILGLLARDESGAPVR